MDSQNWQFQIEVIKTLIQLNTEDSQSVLLYGTITLGFVTFSLPLLLKVPITENLYKIPLICGTIFLLIGAGIWIWYSRQVTDMNAQFGTILVELVKQSSFDQNLLFDRLNKIPVYKRADVKTLVQVAKIFHVFGFCFYFYLFVYVIVMKKKLSNSATRDEETYSE